MQVFTVKEYGRFFPSPTCAWWVWSHLPLLGCPGEGVGKVHHLNFTSENADGLTLPFEYELILNFQHPIAS